MPIQTVEISVDEKVDDETRTEDEPPPPDWKNTILYFFTPSIGELCEKYGKADKVKNPSRGDPFEWAGRKPGTQIWRMEKFIPRPWKKQGVFHKGDSYIILRTFLADEEEVDSPVRELTRQNTLASFKQMDKMEVALQYDAHFWVGEESSEDEYGAAFFMTGELNNMLRTKKPGCYTAIHREIQDFESELFLSYFPNGLQYLEGGIEGVDIFGTQKKTAVKEISKSMAASEFKTEQQQKTATRKEDEVEKRFFQVKGRGASVMMTEVKMSRRSMNSGDVFVLDAVDAIIQWNGRDANPDEIEKASRLCRSLVSERGIKGDTQVLEQDSSGEYEDGARFWEMLKAGEKDLGQKLDDDFIITSTEEAGNDAAVLDNWTPKLLRTAASPPEFSVGPIRKISVTDKHKPFKTMLKSKYMYIVDSGIDLQMWVGDKSESYFQQKLFPFATIYTKRFNRPMVLPVHVYFEGQEPPSFWKNFATEEEEEVLMRRSSIRRARQSVSRASVAVSRSITRGGSSTEGEEKKGGGCVIS